MNHIFKRTQHSFFDDLVTLLVSLHSFITAIEVHDNNGTLTMTRQPVSFGGLAVPVDLKFYPHTIMKMIAANRWPSRIVLHEKRLGSSMPAKVGLVLKSSHINRVTSLLTQGAFIRYFETHRQHIESRYGFTRSWPATWNFGRAIRNAFAHGGKINFFPGEPNVSWRGLTYGVSDNGRQIFHRDIAYVETILLMEEMDAFL